MGTIGVTSSTTKVIRSMTTFLLQVLERFVAEDNLFLHDTSSVNGSVPRMDLIDRAFSEGRISDMFHLLSEAATADAAAGG